MDDDSDVAQRDEVFYLLLELEQKLPRCIPTFSAAERAAMRARLETLDRILATISEDPLTH